MTWYSELDFKENPLDVRPNPNLIGLDQEESKLRNHIEKGEICFINGLTGAGKSSMLKRIQETMKGYSFIYLDAQDLPDSFSIEEELTKKRSFFDKITLKKYPTKIPVLIIDEFQDTDKNIVLEARSKWENPNERKIHAVVIAQIEQHLKNVTPSFKERLGNRLIKLPTLSDDEMREVLKIRLKQKDKNYYDKLHSEAINLLVTVADGNPRRLLEYTDAIFDFHYTKFKDKNPIKNINSYLVTYYAAKEILEHHDVNVKAYTYLDPKEKTRKVEKFNKKFSKDEREVILYMLTSPRTEVDIVKHTKFNKTKVTRIIKVLKRKHAVESAGKRGKKQLLKATEHVKRLTVRV